MGNDLVPVGRGLLPVLATPSTSPKAWPAGTGEARVGRGGVGEIGVVRLQRGDDATVVALYRWAGVAGPAPLVDVRA